MIGDGGLARIDEGVKDHSTLPHVIHFIDKYIVNPSWAVTYIQRGNPHGAVCVSHFSVFAQILQCPVLSIGVGKVGIKNPVIEGSLLEGIDPKSVDVEIPTKNHRVVLREELFNLTDKPEQYI
jgi:hypothetical protein